MKDYISSWANFFNSDIKKAKENDTASEWLPYFRPEATSFQQWTKAENLVQSANLWEKHELEYNLFSACIFICLDGEIWSIFSVAALSDLKIQKPHCIVHVSFYHKSHIIVTIIALWKKDISLCLKEHIFMKL